MSDHVNNRVIPAELVLCEGTSKAGRGYEYVSVQVNGEEIQRIFLRSLELKYLFG